MALVFVDAHPGFLSSLSLYCMVLLAVPLSICFAPSKVRRDRRVIVVTALAVVALVGLPLYAFDSVICSYAWWALECWLF